MIQSYLRVSKDNPKFAWSNSIKRLCEKELKVTNKIKPNEIFEAIKYNDGHVSHGLCKLHEIFHYLLVIASVYTTKSKQNLYCSCQKCRIFTFNEGQ